MCGGGGGGGGGGEGGEKFQCKHVSLRSQS